MLKVSYKLAVGKWSVNSADDPRTELAGLDTTASLDSPNDACRIWLYVPPARQPGLLEEAVAAAAGALGLGGSGEREAFSVQVRGESIKQGDQITIELAAGDVSAKVMTAEVHSVCSSFGQTMIRGKTGMQKLAEARINQVYENQTLAQIVKDLASRASVDTGEIETGNTYSYFVVHESKSLLRHLRELAMRDGMDLFFDADNKLTLKKFNKSSADHTFYFGIDILDLEVFNHRMTSEHILVSGESPASSRGSDTWHWIAKDLSPFQSEIGQESRSLSIRDGAVRTKDAAERLAASKFGALKDHSAWGRLTLLGNPKVKLADAIEIKNAPKPELNGRFKVASVRHILNKREGYLTLVGFTGLGGAQKAGGLLGELAGRLTGALGL